MAVRSVALAGSVSSQTISSITIIKARMHRKSSGQQVIKQVV
ncbi:hypothetical protein COLO4_21617 [Corchorus olitorius]|uniref:Uncharacterized protein n=1 Tax=Corchorus olitorius TaxID=93759 RepID=A0A1R3IS95_9ROSI|nr:hypothetical protein COLO4_21617 [Corchorus olitorius]